jgi:hypothetical protein
MFTELSFINNQIKTTYSFKEIFGPGRDEVTGGNGGDYIMRS